MRSGLLPMLLTLHAAIVIPLAAQQAGPRSPRIFQSDGADLAKVKQRLAMGDKQIAAAVAELRVQAEPMLRTEPCTIVNRTKRAPSGDKHDYVSMAPYFWPDPDKKDGLPYIRKDGRVNPEREQYDAPLLQKLSRTIGPLGLAYYLTGEERHAEHAARMLRVWFLDRDTRMNPHLKYAQFIPGITEGRGIGIIDSVAFLAVIDTVGLIEGSRSWSKTDQAGMKEWFTAYVQWLRTSKNGKDEAAALNNHGSWYDVQLATFALFIGEADDAVKKLLEESKAKRIARQIEPDGRQPLELRRTKSFDYSQGNLRALFALATLGDRVGVDLWHFETNDGRSIRKALDWLIPYATGEKKWEHEQLGGVRGGSLAPLLRRAAVAYRNNRYENVLDKLSGRGDLGTAGLLYPNPR
jgi:hypothetical protein